MQPHRRPFRSTRKVYDDCWVNRKEGEFFCATDFYGIMLPLGKRAQMGGPLFWVHYSYTGLDPRGLADRFANYWEQNRRYTLVDRAYCIDNPYRWVGYGPDFWGLTACDALPEGYRAHTPASARTSGRSHLPPPCRRCRTRPKSRWPSSKTSTATSGPSRSESWDSTTR